MAVKSAQILVSKAMHSIFEEAVEALADLDLQREQRW